MLCRVLVTPGYALPLPRRHGPLMVLVVHGMLRGPREQVLRTGDLCEISRPAAGAWTSAGPERLVVLVAHPERCRIGTMPARSDGRGAAAR